MTDQPDFYMDGYKRGALAGKDDGKRGSRWTSENGLVARFNEMEPDAALVQREGVQHLEQTRFWLGFGAGYQHGFHFARHVEE